MRLQRNTSRERHYVNGVARRKRRPRSSAMKRMKTIGAAGAIGTVASHQWLHQRLKSIGYRIAQPNMHRSGGERVVPGNTREHGRYHERGNDVSRLTHVANGPSHSIQGPGFVAIDKARNPFVEEERAEPRHATRDPECTLAWLDDHLRWRQRRYRCSNRQEQRAVQAWLRNR